MRKHKMKNSKMRILFFHIVFPVIIGGIFYYLTAPDVIFVKRIHAVIGGVIHLPVIPTDNLYLKLIRNYFLDMLWGYALVFALFYIMDNNTVITKRIFWTAFLFSAGMELLQIMPFVPGTFDILDIGVEFLAEVIAVFIIKRNKNKTV